MSFMVIVRTLDKKKFTIQILNYYLLELLCLGFPFITPKISNHNYEL